MKLQTRYLWPTFFSNEKIASLDPLCRIFFQGLWCAADREGRMEDCPKRLKALILPYDQFDPEAALKAMEAVGLIVRYQTETERAIQILSWAKSGKPFQYEKDSLIQPPSQTKPYLAPSQPLASDKLAPSLLLGLGLGVGLGSSKEEIGSVREREGNGLDAEVLEVFEAYCKSWGRNPKTYKLTPKREKWVRQAIQAYGKAGALLGVENFRHDEYEDRARFNDIEYLFGGTEDKRQKRVDKYCQPRTLENTKAYQKGMSSHHDARETGLLALEILKAKGNQNDKH